MELQGKIKIIFDTQCFDSGFKKREFVLRTAGEYPQDLKMHLVKDKCDWLNSYSEGESISVNIELRGSEYNGRYFVNLQCWKISKV